MKHMIELLPLFLLQYWERFEAKAKNLILKMSDPVIGRGLY